MEPGEAEPWWQWHYTLTTAQGRDVSQSSLQEVTVTAQHGQLENVKSK